MLKNKKNTIYLYLNTSKNRELDVFLISNNKQIDKIIQTGDYKVTEYLLKLIEKILKNNKIDPSDLKGIITITGPGPFTSLRIAVAVANALSYSLHIPVVGIQNKQKIEDNDRLLKLGLKKMKLSKSIKYISPFYDRGPNITLAKK
ncbi:MAG: tRNA (adenosine(37)-N6)-threonylcarbamoyltransferase complex dimerization subunit type 1 TsaB [Candidatus Parcubacteria bacterium]|nr:tRNA (adenosine(37)-N6)-threonylcarbamoyltransferase complex dimerization subunit type 1 TsaB [Candidatus Parcubacteria bacterium]